MTPSALLTDFDGVLRLWPPVESETEAEFGLPSGAVRREAFEPSLLSKVSTGQLTDTAWRTVVAQRLSERYPWSQASEAVARWSEPCGELDPEVFQLLQGVRAHLSLILVTNATDRLPRDLEALGLGNAFDGIANSSQLGHAKPSPVVFEHALALANCPASRALYVDDSPINVKAAAELGIRALHYTGVASLRVVIQERVLPPNAA